MPKPLTPDAINELLDLLLRTGSTNEAAIAAFLDIDESDVPSSLLGEAGARAALSDALFQRDWHPVLSLAPKSSKDVQDLKQAGIELFKPAKYVESESSHRWNVFNTILEYLDDTEYWVPLGRCWMECEKRVDLLAGRSLFFPHGRDYSLRRLMMDPLEQRVFDALPQNFTVFRGGRFGGWCWTTRTYLAQDFASTESAIELTDADFEPLPFSKDPDDAMGTHARNCMRENVLAVFFRKGESEVVVDWTKLSDFLK